MPDLPPTKESGADDRLWVKDERIRLLEAERDALRAFVEQVSWLDPKRGPMDIHTMVGHARRLLDRPE